MKVTVATGSQIPIYEQIKLQIKEAILSHELKEGEQMPSIRSLAKELRVGIITTKRAYEDLANEGFLISQSGKGYYVSSFDHEKT